MSRESSSLSWVEKYKPRTFKEIIGNEAAKGKILQWIHSWEKGIPKKKVLFLYGPPGVGKTVSCEALANDLNMDLVQSNASDFRTEEAVKNFAGRASENATLFGKKRLILFDELDGITGSSDRGGLRQLNDIAKKTMVPMIVTANNAYEQRFRTLRSNCLLVEFKKPTRTEIMKHLRNVSNMNKIEVEEEALKFMAEKANGDVRSAINDLQTLAQDKKLLRLSDVSWLSDRDRQEAIFNVLRMIFYARDSIEAKRALDMADVDAEMLYEWIYENLPHQIRNPAELVRAMENLARADIYRARIRKTQNWSLLRYFLDLMTAGVASSWSKKSPGWVPFKFPARISSLSRTRSQRALQASIAARIGKKCHTSVSVATADILPYIVVILENQPEKLKELTKWLDLNDDMTDYFTSEKGKHI